MLIHIHETGLVLCNVLSPDECHSGNKRRIKCFKSRSWMNCFQFSQRKQLCGASSLVPAGRRFASGAFWSFALCKYLRYEYNYVYAYYICVLTSYFQKTSNDYFTRRPYIHTNHRHFTDYLIFQSNLLPLPHIDLLRSSFSQLSLVVLKLIDFSKFKMYIFNITKQQQCIP